MSTTDEAFNWRAFWADLLQGSGRALLTLDGSDEARAALVGLDHFDAMQNRRAELARNPVDESANDPSTAQVEPWPERNGSEIFRSPPPDWWSLRSPGRAKARPMSANPYDFEGLPVRVSFPPTGLPVVRRR